MTRVHVTGTPGLILPPHVRPHQSAHLRIQGIIKSVELIDVRTGIIKQKLGPFPNLIVDAALNAIGNGTSLGNLCLYVGVGTDNTTPVIGDTSLGAQVDGRYNDDGGFADVWASGPAYAYWELSRTRVIAEDDGNGNLTELGFFEQDTGGTMWCRQLFLDGSQLPTTITKTDEEQLRIIYAVRVYPSLTPVNDVFNIDGISTTCANRAMQVNSDDAWGANGVANLLGTWSEDDRRSRAYESNTFPAVDGGMFTGNSEVATTITNQAYSSGNFYRDFDIIFDPGTGNFVTGIGAVSLPYMGSFIGGDHSMATTFTPKVDKSNLERFTFRSRLSFGRH